MENPAGAPVAPVPEGAQTWMLIDAWVLPAQLIVGVSIFVFLPAETGEVIINAAMAKAARAAVTVVLHLLLLIRDSSLDFESSDSTRPQACWGLLNSPARADAFLFLNPTSRPGSAGGM